MYFGSLAFVLPLLAILPVQFAAGIQQVDGNSSIALEVDGSPLTITTTQRLAGAVDSIRWKGVEFIDSHDHGRQMQSASSFDAGSREPFWAERFNPTEAGSRHDGSGPTSSSKLLAIQTAPQVLRTSTQMAFWLRPGERSEGRPALNKELLSKHVLHKRIRLGAYSDPHVIQVDNTFDFPTEESHQFAQFEVLTGYMPGTFSAFWRLDPGSFQIVPLDDGPGEQKDPVILATPDAKFAMGAIGVGHPQWISSQPGYGRFRFAAERVVKWNVVYRYQESPRIQKDKASFRILVCIGSLEQVHAAMQAILRGELKER